MLEQKQTVQDEVEMEISYEKKQIDLGHEQIFEEDFRNTNMKFPDQQLKRKNNNREERKNRQKNQLGMEKPNIAYRFYNDHKSGLELIQNIIDVIRHQQYILDNMDHLNEYNQELLEIWRIQINLLDRYDRFQFYKQLGSLKRLICRLKSISPVTIEDFLLENNTMLIEQMKEMLQQIIKDCTNLNMDGQSYSICFGQSSKYIQNFKSQNKEVEWRFLKNIQTFVLKVIGVIQLQNHKQWICKLCGSQQQYCEELIDHIEKQHLRCFNNLLLGGNDKCFFLNCNSRRGNRCSKNYNIRDHLKSAHSHIFNEDKIFSKLYGNISSAEQYFYGSDEKNWKKKFQEHLEEWLENVDPGSEQFIQDSRIFINKRRDGLFQFIKSWMETDESLKKCELDGGYGEFDQLCYFLKFSWRCSEGNQDEGELSWIKDKLKNEPRRIFMIDTFADLLDTNMSLLAQLHQYLYLGVFSFRQCQLELISRIQCLDNYIMQLGIFQAYLYNSENFAENCIFNNVLCQSQNCTFKFPSVMYEHYYDAHLGVFIALSNQNLQTDLKEFKQSQIFERRMNGQLIFNIFQELKLGEFIHFLYDHYKSDYKTRSKLFMWNARKNFQLKCICCDCKKEISHFGEVYWKDNEVIGQQKQQLKFIHKQTVSQVIQVYKDGNNKIWGIQGNKKIETWSELDIINDQCEIFKQKMLKEMRNEILIDDKSRKSRCKECHMKLKVFNPILKELKEEYFKLPLDEPTEDCILGSQENSRNQKQYQQQQIVKKLVIRETDPRFIKVQKQILNRLAQQTEGWTQLKNQIQGGYFRINSFPKLVQIYGDISESVSQNSRRVISQPILSGYMKVLFQTPLIYIPGTAIIYEMQPQWAKVRHQFKLFGSSDLQRKEFVQMLEEHPIIQNHTYQMTNLTKLCINQVDLIYQLNKHLMKRTCELKNKNSDWFSLQEQKVNQELTKTSDLLYFEGVLHRAQVIFLIQQFKIWTDVYENVLFRIEEFIKKEKLKPTTILNNSNSKIRAEEQLNLFNNLINSNAQKQSNNFILMMILSFFYCEEAYNQQNMINNIKFFRGLKEDNWNFLDYIFNNQNEETNFIRFYFQSHLLPILTPIIEQHIHPIFLGTLLQLFQLTCQSVENQGEDAQKISLLKNEVIVFYLNVIYNRLSNLTIKRCIPLFDFDKELINNEQESEEIGEQKLGSRRNQNETEQEKERIRKLKKEGRLFQLKLFIRLDQQQQIDMQCRYVLAKRSLVKVLNSKKEDPPIDCDLRWSMQIAQMFFNSIRKRSRHGNDDETRVAQENVQELKDLKEEVDHYFCQNKTWIPEDFLFKTYKQKKLLINGKEEVQELTSDLRSLLEEIIKEDKGAQINQTFNQNPYKYIHRLKLAFYIPMEKKLQDIVSCIAKLRSLPHRQTYRSLEKFHNYNFRELEMLAFPELFVTGQGFQQYSAPRIEKSSIIVALEQDDKKKAQEALSNLKQFKINNQLDLQQQEEKLNHMRMQNEVDNVLFIQASLSDFTTQYRQGQSLPYPKNAVLELNKEEYVKSQLTSAYVYDMQKISVVKIFQEASENISVAERSFKLDQEIQIKISEDEVLADSLKNQHILKNFRQILKKQLYWSNECQAFVRKITDEVNKSGYQISQNKEIDPRTLDYIRLQEKLFLEKKRLELAEQFKNLDLSQLDTLPSQHINIKKAKLKRSKKSKKCKNSFQDFEEELHSEVIQSIQPLDEITECIQKAVATFSTQYTSIGEDTKFRLLNKATRAFNWRFSFIFWRYTQRLISRIFCYYAVVNGINFYEKQQTKAELEDIDNDSKKVKELEKLPPIKGSNQYFKEKYKEQRAISFQKGTPFLFNTFTLNEFNRKTQKIVQGLNFFDLEDDLLLRERQKVMSKNKYNMLQKEFTIYFYYLCKILMQCIMNKTGYLKKDSQDYKLYDFGMYGQCVGYTNRFEFQQRGTIHLHQLLFFCKNQDGQIDEKLLEYWAAVFSLWNCNLKEQDHDFITKFQLEHACNENCIKADSYNICRKGYPRQLNSKSSWKCDYFNQIFGRVQSELEQNFFMHDRDVVKFFGSSCIIEACGNDKIIDYITKYMNKQAKSLNENQEVIGTRKKEESDSEVGDSEIEQSNKKKLAQTTGNEEKQEEKESSDVKDVRQSLKQQANELIHKVLSQKVTSISEAYSDLLDYPLFKTSFTCVKIAQVPLSEQYKINTKTIKDCFDLENPDQDLKSKIKSCIWIKYLSRPDELEFLTLTEYLNNFLWYGGKQRYKLKADNQGEKNLYLLDQNGQIVKQREKAFDIIIQLSQVYYQEDLDYKLNLFYLAMLQLFWPHRQEQWLNETKDTYEGFTKAYQNLYNKNERRTQGDSNSINQQYLDKFGAFQTFKEAVDNYKQLTKAQQKFLKAIQFVPKKKVSRKEQEDEIKKVRLYKQYFTYHSLLRAKNSIVKLNGQLEQEEHNFKFIKEVKGILNLLRPDILLNSNQKDEIIQVEDQIISFIKNNSDNGWNGISDSQKCILEELSSLLKNQHFYNLYNFILDSMKSLFNVYSNNQSQSSNKKQTNIFTKLEQSTNTKIAQNEIDQFFDSSNEMIEFPQHFRTALSKNEFKNLIRPRLNNNFFDIFNPSQELEFIFSNQLNTQQQLAILILLHYFYQSQVIEKEDEAIYEGCLIHGGGGVGKSFIIEFLLKFFEESDLPYFVLCPTQVSVQNILKDKQKNARIMTIHSFFHLQPHSTIDSSYDHFLAFLRYIQKQDLYKSSTAQLYPELSFYNCMNKADKFTEKLKGVRTILLEEISMIPPKFISLLDIYLQVSLSNNLPFGGIQIFAFGDSFQLQPVTQPPAYYFQSHVFQGNFFSTYLELTMPVRQASDLLFYKDILQPIRVGQFRDHEKFRNSIRLLKLRHLNDKINNQTGFNLAQGLQMQVQRLQIDNDITFLYFDNEAVQRENQIRADQHIQAQQLKYQDSRQQFRIFLNSPARLSFGVNSTNQDQLLINISQNYQIFNELIEQDSESVLQSYALHFKLLPLTIRNYLLQSLLPHVYESARLQNKQSGFNFPLKIKLFKNAQIVFRKNLDKEKQMINGQAGIIVDLLFEVDFKPEEMRNKQADKKEEKMEQLLIQGLIKHKSESNDYQKYEFNSEFIKIVQEQLQQQELNNVNCFFDDEILESEKQNFLINGIQPRLSAMSIKISGSEKIVHLKNIEQYFKGVTVQVASEKIKGIAKEALQQIQILNSRLKVVDGGIGQKEQIIENLFKQNQNYIRLLGLSVLLNQLDTHLLKRTQYHLSQFIEKLNEENTPMIINQIPINLAYARTIHTSQGATFKNICVTLDPHNLNRPGLLYTAFSRVRNLQSLFIQGAFDEDIFNDNLPEELKIFFKKKFVCAEEMLSSKFFKELLFENQITFKQSLIKLTKQNTLFRKKLIGYLSKQD